MQKIMRFTRLDPVFNVFVSILLFDTDCLSKLLQKQVSTEVHERPHGQSMRSLLQRAEKER